MANHLRLAGLALAAALSFSLNAAPVATAHPPVSVLAEAPVPSNQQFIGAIQTVIGNRPALSILKVVNPQPDWFVVTMRDAELGQNALVILEQESGPLNVVAGPGGYFPTIAVPEAVQQYLVSINAK